MLAVVAVLVAVGRVLPSHGLTLLGYGLALVLVVPWLLGRRKLPIDARRSELPSRVPARRTVEAEITLVGRRRVTAIVVEESLEANLGAPIRVGIPVLPTGQEVTHSYAFTPAVRGIYSVGPLIAEFSDPFGLTRRRQEIAKATTIIVHPLVEPVLDRIISREWEDPPIRPPVSRPWPSGYEFYGMREYQDGDDVRRIVWRAVAQHGKYLVREAEQGITDRVNIYLNSDATGHARGEPSVTFEMAVSVAASLAARHLADGFAVSVDTNAERVATSLRGAGKRIPMLDALAALKADAAPLTQALDRLLVDPQRNAHNVLITPQLSRAAATRLRLLLERGTSLLVVLLLWEDSDPMTLHRAAGLRCNVVEVTPGASLGSVFALVSGGSRR
ncbi:MAG: DUF58 domain-containing protein [Mycobacteriales bacterium]